MGEIIRTPSAGEVIDDRYLLIRKLGSGGFGSVFLATQDAEPNIVAVKVLSPKGVASPKVLRRFAQEAELARSLRHPNTVRVFEAGTHTWDASTRALPFLTMEYLHGETLHQLLGRQGTIAIEQILPLFGPVLESLCEAHQRNIVHRDIKPSNIFLAWAGDSITVKVLDFGIAKALDPDSVPGAPLTTENAPGTPDYMPPELALDASSVTTAADVYAVACTIFVALAGHPLYDGRSPLEVSLRHVSAPLPPMPESIRETPLAEVLTHALAKDPRQRHANAGELLEALENAYPEVHLSLSIPTPSGLLSIEDLIQPAPGPSPAAAPNSSNYLWAAVAAAASAIALVAIAYIVWPATPTPEPAVEVIAPVPDTPESTTEIAPAEVAGDTGHILDTRASPSVSVDAPPPRVPNAPAKKRRPKTVKATKKIQPVKKSEPKPAEPTPKPPKKPKPTLELWDKAR